MNLADWTLVLLAALLALLSAVISAAETAIFYLPEGLRKQMRKRYPAATKRVERLLDKPSHTLHALLLADTLVNLPLIFVCVLLARKMAFTAQLPDWLTAAAVFFVVILVGELLPKFFAVSMPAWIARASSRFAILLVRIFGGLAERINRAIKEISAIFRRGKPQISSHLSEAEFFTLVELSAQEGTLRPVESRMIREIIKLGHEPASHCMTPRVDAFALPDDLSDEEATTLLRTKNYRHSPVYGETPDDVLGILDVTEYLLHPGPSYLEQLQPPAFVPETMNALELLRNFLNRKQALAILLDEYGGIAGVVTLSDLLEELLGEEGASAQSELYIERIHADRLLASGNARLDDLGEFLNYDFGNENADTLGGLIVERLGQLPKAGTDLPLGEWLITVRRATRKRIREVLIERADKSTRPEGVTP